MNNLRTSPSGPFIDGVNVGDVLTWNGSAWVPTSAALSDDEVKVSATDTTPGFLIPKIGAGAGIALAILNPGANEQLLFTATGAPPTGPAGGDLAGTYPNPLVVGLVEAGGPTDLAIGPISTGQALVRSGGTILGVNVAGGSFFWGAGNVATTVVTRFLQPGYQSGVAPTTGVRIPIRRSGTIRNLSMRNRLVGVGAALMTFTVLLNGVATALTFSTAPTAASGFDSVNTVPVVAGDFIELRVTKAAAITTSPVDIEVAVDFGP